MNFLSLLGMPLKDAALIAILEEAEMEVIYDFDRLGEGQPDLYWASAHAAGFLFRFDATQHLDTIFLYVLPAERFAAWAGKDPGFPLFADAADACMFAESNGLVVKSGDVDFLGVTRHWVRLGFHSHSIHYEFHASRLALVTVMRGV